MTTIYGYVRGTYGMLLFTGNEMSGDITPAGFFGTSIMDISWDGFLAGFTYGCLLFSSLGDGLGSTIIWGWTCVAFFVACGD